MKLTIITIGKLKEDYWKQAEAEYLKRLQPFAKIEIKELKEEKFDDKSNHDIIREKEADKIIKAIPDNSYVIALDKDGTQYSSENLAEKVTQLTNNQINQITIIIGGPLGLTDKLKNIAKESISFSKMTFTHQMIRIILLEQIYRAYMIKEGRKYHW